MVNQDLVGRKTMRATNDQVLIDSLVGQIPMMMTPVGMVLAPYEKQLPNLQKTGTNPVVSHIYNENHLYGIGLINSGLDKKDVKRKPNQPITYSNYPPAVKLH